MKEGNFSNNLGALAWFDVITAAKVAGRGEFGPRT
jgi:hypothetical protein